jgi:hypothetical protein
MFQAREAASAAPGNRPRWGNIGVSLSMDSDRHSMNATPPTVVPILATPFGVVPLPEVAALNPALGALFAARAGAPADADGGRAQLPNPLVHRSRDDLLEWPDEPVRRLTAGIFRGVSAVAAAVNDFSDAQLRALKVEARGWFTVIKTDGHVPAASHPLTAWCAIYCVSAPAPSATRHDGGVVRIYESRLGTMYQDATLSAMRIPFTQAHYAWRPVPGQMAVFPASLTHEIAMFRSPGELVLVTARVRFVAPGQQGVARW